MILGIGIDLVDIPRLDRVLTRHGDRARRRLFTEAEVVHCTRSSNPAEKYASRFAAKEAFFKAVGTGWGRGLAWTEVEVVSNPAGAPSLQLHGAALEHFLAMGGRRTHLSLTHAEAVAGAFLVLEG